MNVLIIGHFPAHTKQLIEAIFPHQWVVHIVTPDQAQPYLATAEAIIPEHVPVTAAMLSQTAHLKVIQTGAGYDNVDLNAASAHGATVCNAAGVNANALGMKVLAYNRHPKALANVESTDLATIYTSSDVISLHIEATPTTRHMINAQTLAQMKSTALLVNTARGALIDESALAHALQSHQIAGACLDVFEQEPLPMSSSLRQLPNVILTPHTAGLPDGVKFHRQRYVFFRDNLQRIANNKEPLNIVN